MSLILRKLDRKAGFYNQEWLPDGDVQADALTSLRTKGNRLSVWSIDDDRSNLSRVIAALAAGRDYLDKLDYAIIDDRDLASLGVRVVRVDGESSDEGANQRWHRDLITLSGRQLVGSAACMRGGLTREPKSRVRELVVESVQSEFVARNSLKAGLLRALEVVG